jgi:hypothetical protein
MNFNNINENMKYTDGLVAASSKLLPICWTEVITYLSGTKKKGSIQALDGNRQFQELGGIA